MLEKNLPRRYKNKNLLVMAMMIALFTTNLYAEEDPDHHHAKSMEEVIRWAEEQNKILPEVKYTINGKEVSKEEYISYTEKQYEAERKMLEEIKSKGKKVIRDGYIVYVMPDGSEHSFGEGGAEDIDSFIDRTNKAKAEIMHDVKNLKPMQHTTIMYGEPEIIRTEKEHKEALEILRKKRKTKKEQKPLGLDVKGFWNTEEPEIEELKDKALE
jgi:hypothetical protein